MSYGNLPPTYGGARAFGSDPTGYRAGLAGCVYNGLGQVGAVTIRGKAHYADGQTRVSWRSMGGTWTRTCEKYLARDPENNRCSDSGTRTNSSTGESEPWSLWHIRDVDKNTRPGVMGGEGDAGWFVHVPDLIPTTGGYLGGYARLHGNIPADIEVGKEITLQGNWMGTPPNNLCGNCGWDFQVTGVAGATAPVDTGALEQDSPEMVEARIEATVTQAEREALAAGADQKEAEEVAQYVADTIRETGHPPPTGSGRGILSAQLHPYPNRHPHGRPHRHARADQGRYGDGGHPGPGRGPSLPPLRKAPEMTYMEEPPTYGGARAFGVEPTGYRAGLGQVDIPGDASVIPGLPEFGTGMPWPDFMAQARQAFLSYATRNTGGSIDPAGYTRVMEAASNWANGQIAQARVSGADIYRRALAQPKAHYRLVPTNTAVPPEFRRGDPPREYFLGEDVIRAWEQGTPITYGMWEQGVREWEALQAQKSAEEAARLEAEAQAQVEEAVTEFIEAGETAVEAPPEADTGGVVSITHITEEGDRIDIPVEDVVTLPTGGGSEAVTSPTGTAPAPGPGEAPEATPGEAPTLKAGPGMIAALVLGGLFFLPMLGKERK